MAPRVEGVRSKPILPGMPLSAEAFTKLLAGSVVRMLRRFLKLGGAKQPLPNFEIAGTDAGEAEAVRAGILVRRMCWR